MTLMFENGKTKEDIKLPSDKELLVTIIKSNEEEKIMINIFLKSLIWTKNQNNNHCNNNKFRWIMTQYIKW